MKSQTTERPTRQRRISLDAGESLITCPKCLTDLDLCRDHLQATAIELIKVRLMGDWHYSVEELIDARASDTTTLSEFSLVRKSEFLITLIDEVVEGIAKEIDIPVEALFQQATADLED